MVALIGPSIIVLIWAHNQLRVIHLLQTPFQTLGITTLTPHLSLGQYSLLIMIDQLNLIDPALRSQKTSVPLPEREGKLYLK